MAENIKEEFVMEKVEIKEEEDLIKVETCFSYGSEETCTRDVQEEDVKMENTENEGKDYIFIEIKKIVYPVNRINILQF